MRPYLIILGAGPSPENGMPMGIQRVAVNKRILDCQLEAFKNIGPEVDFVGGYDIEEIIKIFPELTYHYNPLWESTGAVASLRIAMNAISARSGVKRDIYISYSDILYQSRLVDSIENESRRSEGLIYSIDGLGAEGNGSKGDKTELVKLNSVNHEFIGLIKISAKYVEEFYAYSRRNS